MKSQLEDTMETRIALHIGLRELYPHNGESNEAMETWIKSDTGLGDNPPTVESQMEHAGETRMT